MESMLTRLESANNVRRANTGHEDVDMIITAMEARIAAIAPGEDPWVDDFHVAGKDDEKRLYSLGMQAVEGVTRLVVVVERDKGRGDLERVRECLLTDCAPSVKWAALDAVHGLFKKCAEAMEAEIEPYMALQAALA